MSEEMEVYGTKQVAKYEEIPYIPIPGVAEYMEETDTALPRVKLLQDGSPEVKEGIVPKDSAGKFYTIEGEVLDTIDGVIIGFKKQRIYFKKPFNKDNDPVCASDDFSVPSERIENPCSESCLDCKHKDFGPDGEAPDCSMVYVYLIATESGEVMILSARSTNIPMLKPLNKALKAGLRSVHRIGTKEVHDGRGDWFVVTTKTLRRLTPEEAVAYGQLSGDYRDYEIRAEEEQTVMSNSNGEVIDHGTDLDEVAF